MDYQASISKSVTYLFQVLQIQIQFNSLSGTFFQNVDYSQIRPDLNDVEMCKFLAEEHKIVAIPVSVFYKPSP